MKIIHIINSLNKGGAEGNLFRLIKFQKKKYLNNIDIIVITLISNGYYEVELKKLGIEVISLNISKKNKFLDLIRILLKLRRFIIKKNPDIIQSWMYHSNFISIFIPRQFYDKLFWNIRHSELNIFYSKITTILLSMICGLASNIIPKKIIYCSEKSINFHLKYHFYSKKKTELIYNGFDQKTYYPQRNIHLNFRKKNKIKKKIFVLGYAGRYAKQKNIFSIIMSFSKLTKINKNVCLFMVGKDISVENKNLTKFVKELKISHKVFFLSEQKNLLDFYNGIDLLILASHSESFPNVIAESMLCKTPVLSSNAGCAKKIINTDGFIMKDNKSITIFRNLKRILNLFQNNRKKWIILKKNSRSHIIKNFSLEIMAEKYMQKWIF